ncbi:DNA starvation/stationary phase protection protein [Halothiobacillus diazotrophicus]|uniref:DNA starvation/stationary phase protection protein n=1 Tax=Halothiobacillus diazotrophicus TaxID=1860122 RepID=A0A191ZE14_9GAMM|nr:Dps family protein [Halothiobacillus diazotrophicus]ANJ66107.1 DNA starvation/stationary phase protection protein [Halothiobacillus diazotrophicus]
MAKKKTTQSDVSDIQIGIPQADRQSIAEGLSKLLADSYSLFLMTHNFHWNVTGPQFNSLHLMFETQYTELFTAVDEVAERIRSLGEPAPASFSKFTALASFTIPDEALSANDMIAHLVKGQEAVVRTARALFPVAEKANDQPTLDLLTRRMELHEKNAWMLRALLA